MEKGRRRALCSGSARREARGAGPSAELRSDAGGTRPACFNTEVFPPGARQASVHLCWQCRGPHVGVDPHTSAGIQTAKRSGPLCHPDRSEHTVVGTTEG
ncbi:hypothetical protein GN956_G5083 [Arapaima gigas]